MSAAAPLTVHLMTASLAPGDAIGNYLLMQARILRGWGARVYLYADHVDPRYGALAGRSADCRPQAGDILWFHYSIDAENIAHLDNPVPYKLLDYHGVSPPELFAGQNAYLEQLCRRAIERLPTLPARVDAAVVHSGYTEQELIACGFSPERVLRVPLAVETERFAAPVDAGLTDRLRRLDYWLFVGRIVPQKDTPSLVRLFAAVQRARPQTALLLVGSHHLAPRHKRAIDRLIRKLGVQRRVFFLGQINDPAVLGALYRHARFYCALSDWESFCVPVAEALFCGTPTVVHNVPPLPEVTGPGGLVIDKRDISAAAAAILNLLDQPARYAALRAAAAQFGARYTDQALADNLLALLRRLWNV